MAIFGEVRAELLANPAAYADAYQTIISIVQAGEEICQSLDEDGAPASVDGEALTSTPEAGVDDLTATPTP